jgi:phosphatidylinositol glycan class S
MASAAEKIEQDDVAASRPPVERASAIWTRRFVILAFWTVVVCLGLPLWTWTTTIHRSELPLESMNAWAEGRVRSIASSRSCEVNNANVCDRLATSLFLSRYPYLPAT